MTQNWHVLLHQRSSTADSTSVVRLMLVDPFDSPVLPHSGSFGTCDLVLECKTSKHHQISITTIVVPLHDILNYAKSSFHDVRPVSTIGLNTLTWLNRSNDVST